MHIYIYIYILALLVCDYSETWHNTYRLIAQKKRPKLSEGRYKKKRVRPAVDEAECKWTLAFKG